MEVESNYNQYLKMLLAYPKIKILTEENANTLLGEILRKYQGLAITDMHYFWSHSGKIPMSEARMNPHELIEFYGTRLIEKLPAGSDFHLIVDCCDGRFIVCLGEAENYIEMLKDNYFELVEFYFTDIAKNIVLCIDHTFNVRWYI